MLALHRSNRYRDLPPVVRGLAREGGKEMLQIERKDDARLGIEGRTRMLVTGNEAFAASAKSSAQAAGDERYFARLTSSSIASAKY